GIVLSPVVVMLGEPVRGADHVVALLRGAVLVHVRLVFPNDRTGGLVWVKRIGDRAFDGLVVLGERSVGEDTDGNEQAAYTLGIHDEGAHVILGFGIGFEVGHIHASPLLVVIVPPDLPAGGIPGFAVQVAGGAVVHDTAVGRPRPSPVRIDSEPRGILGAPALH